MITRFAPDTWTISRRATLQAALAAVIAGKALGRTELASAQTDSPAPWNRGGNAGHTGELPGPGLDLEQPLGVLWRLPVKEFVSNGYALPDDIAGYWNGVLYTRNGGSLWARRLQDGAFLWAQSPNTLQPLPASTPTADASPEAGAQPVSFSRRVAIDNGFLLATMDNGELWGLDAATGEFRWKLNLGSSDDSPIATVEDHVAYVDQLGAIVAYDLTDPPALRWSWNAEAQGYNAGIVGVLNERVYVWKQNDEGTTLHALAANDGSELWRLTGNDLGGLVNRFYGVASTGIALDRYDPVSGEYMFMLLNHNGEVAWSSSSSDRRVASWWMTEGAVIHASSRYDLTIEALHPENGKSGWQFETPYSVDEHASYAAYYGLLCDGKAYGGVPDNNWIGPMLVIIDPISTEMVAARGIPLRPVFVADGIMIAHDDETDEIVAIGSVSGGLQAGGRATVTRDATLRGAPNDAAIERAQVTTGALVEITGDGETSNGMEWVPVTVTDTGKSGYLPADALEGQDGSIRFDVVTPSELAQFGQLTIFPKFTSGTRAEIAEETELRGAPGESSAGRGTLAVGTAVTVTSSPTIGTTGDAEWCSISVDATGDIGWVPISVLKLVASA